jgi:hypothetical protein
VGLGAARWVRIQAGARRVGLEGLGGFDLDAVAALHSFDIAGAADADGDGIPDGADVCPLVADPGQSDVDADGAGDACDVEALPPDADADGVPDAYDVCPLALDAAQDDADADGAGDACDRCPGADDPPLSEPCPPLPPDRDADGAPDDEDPCPDDPACIPIEPPVFDGSGRSRGEHLLAYVLPAERRVVVTGGTPALQMVVVIAADTRAGSVRLRVGREDRTEAAGPFVPGSTRTVTVPLAGRRTRIRFAARGIERGVKDRDRFTVIAGKEEGS